MGYTHYWEMPDKSMDEKVLDDIQKIVKEYEDIVQVEFNEGGKTIVDKDVVKFNGKGEMGHETFYLAPAGQSGFCKTNGKPYDLAVCETLLVLKHYYGDEFELSSDGFYVSKEYLDSFNFDGNWNKVIDNVNNRYSYEFELIPKTERSGDFEYHSFDVLSSEEYKERLIEDKKIKLIVDKEIELNLKVVEESLDEKNNLHILCQRYSDNSHVVWTSYHTGEVETSYVDFYNGKYDMSREDGYKELNRRVERGKEELKGLDDVTLLGSGTIGDRDYYDFVEESPLSTKETIIFIDFDEGEITGEQVAYGSWVDLNYEESMEYLNTLDEKDIVRSFEHIKNPIQKERGVESEMER